MFYYLIGVNLMGIYYEDTFLLVVSLFNQGEEVPLASEYEPACGFGQTNPYIHSLLDA